MKRLAETLKAGAGVAASWLPDAMLACGAGAVAYGAALVFPPAGWIVGGLLTLVGGVVLARGVK